MGFSFKSSVALGLVDYEAFGSDSLTGDATGRYASGAIAPNFIPESEPIPEPGTILLLSGGLGGLVMFTRLRKKSS